MKSTLSLMKFKTPQYSYTNPGAYASMSYKNFLLDVVSLKDQDRKALARENIETSFRTHCDRVAEFDPSLASQLRREMNSTFAETWMSKHNIATLQSKPRLNRVAPGFFDTHKPTWENFMRKADAANPGVKLDVDDYKAMLKFEKDDSRLRDQQGHKRGKLAEKFARLERTAEGYQSSSEKE